MSGKLKDYQVLDVLCGGTFYKVRHKVTNNVFAWKAYDCSAYSDEQIRSVVREVRAISEVRAESVLRYYDTILHGPSRTLYLVLEHSRWQSLEALLAVCRAADKLVAEGFVWRLLLELARVCKLVETLKLVVLRKWITAASIFVGEKCELLVNCFELTPTAAAPDAMRQIGDVIHALCLQPQPLCGDNGKFHYSTDLRDIISFLTDDRNSSLRPEVILYHPTVLANLEILAGPKHLSEMLVAAEKSHPASEVNKCDSEKVVELCRVVKPFPRTHFNIGDSPIYSNITPRHKLKTQIVESNSARGSLSPTLAALALELPGFVPRSRKPFSQALQRYDPQKVSEETLSQQWMSRLIALRHREESLNKRERDLIAKEIVNSPMTKIIPINESVDVECKSGSNGITLPPVLTQAEELNPWVSRRRHRRAGSVRARRKTYGYEDLDSSLSADPGDDSVIITATKFTKETMPRRNIFPEVASKKVHFTSANPFVESDESVTLTFYELENVDKEGHQVHVPRQEEEGLQNIQKFKYLDLDKLASEKRAAMQQWHSSPSKQAKMTPDVFSDITNTNGIRKTPSKSSLTSKGSNTSRYSMASCRSQWSVESARATAEGGGGGGGVAARTRAGLRQSLAHAPPHTPPPAPPEVKKSKRKSLLPFKTPFKFKTSTKV